MNTKMQKKIKELSAGDKIMAVDETTGILRKAEVVDVIESNGPYKVGLRFVEDGFAETKGRGFADGDKLVTVSAPLVKAYDHRKGVSEGIKFLKFDAFFERL